MQIWQSATKFNQQQKSGVQYVALHLIAIRHRKCHHPQQAYPLKTRFPNNTYYMPDCSKNS